MSLASFPALPTDGLKSCEWKPVERQTRQFSRNGSGPVLELGRPYWEIDCTYDNLNDQAFRSLSSFLTGLRGARNPFRAYRPSRPKSAGRPDANAGDIEDFERVTTADYDALLLGFVDGEGGFGVGDMVSYRTTANARYVGEVTRVQAEFLRSSRLILFPPVQTPHASAPEPQIVKPEGLFTIVPDSLQMSEPYEPKKRVSFSARQWERAYA